MVDEVKLSYHDYAGIVFGADDTATWLWCQVAEAGKITPEDDFFATVLHGSWQVKVMPMINMVMIMNTGQMMPNARLAYYGRVPAAFSGVYPIFKHLRTGEYANWPGLVDTGAF